MKLKVSKIGDPKPKELTPQQRQEWNAYVSYVEKKGYSGSPLLDKKETGLATKLFNQFKQENPSVSLTLEHIPAVQTEMQKLKDTAQGFAARRNDPNAKNIMSGVSPVDGWPGSKTTQFKFPSMTAKDYHNDTLVAQKNLGLVDPQLQPTGVASLRKPLPKNAKLETLSDGKLYYQDEHTGEMVLYK